MRDRGQRGWNLLQKAETVGNLIDVEVSILPRVNVDTLPSALKQPQHNTHVSIVFHPHIHLFLMFDCLSSESLN